MVERAYYDLVADPFNGAFDPVSGDIPVPSEPGLGQDPDPGVVRDFRV